MSEPLDLPPLREVIRQHNLRAEKALGQNFLLDGNITDKIVRLSGDLAGLHMVEIGPGPGGLTRSLLASPAASVTAIEFDPRAVAAITELKHIYGERLSVIHGDALKTDVTKITPAPRAIAANLPYNISTVLLTNWLERIHADPTSITFMALMFQKEVAERIMTPSGSKTYGRLSVLAQWLTTPKKLFDLPPSAFTPPPKISSSVIHFTPKNLGQDKPDFDLFEDITAKAFGQRRKMIRSSLADYKDALAATGIDPTLRAEDLSVDQFVAIAQAVKL